MAMETEMFGGWGFLIVLILFMWILFGGGNLFNRGGGYGVDWDVERREMIDSAQTQYRVIDENRRSTELLSAQMRNQWDAEQGEKLFDLKLNNLALQQGYEAKLIAKDATIERMTLAQQMNTKFDAVMTEIASIKCNMLGKPPVYGVGTSCNAIYAPTPFLNNGCGGCGNGVYVG
jgi:hypothetical protein